MKKNCRLLWAVLCLLLLCACGQKTPEPEPEQPEPEPEAPQVIALECSDGELTLRFHRGEDGAWLWTDNPAFPLDGGCVDRLLESALALDGLTPLPDAEGPEAYGLYDARKYVTLESSDGTSVTYRLGSEVEGTGCYVNSDGDPARICLAPLSLLDQVGQSIYTMALLPQLPALSSDQIRDVTLIRGSKTEQYTLYGGNWRSDGRDANEQPEVQALEALLAGPALKACVDFSPSDGAAELCGLKPAELIVQVAYDEGEYTLTVGAAAEDGASRFVTVDDDTTIYLMDAALLDALLGGDK